MSSMDMATGSMSAGMTMSASTSLATDASPAQLIAANQAAELSDAPALHAASAPNTQAKSLADASSSMAMSNPANLPISPTLAEITAPIGYVGASAFWALTLLFAAAFVGCLYVYRRVPAWSRFGKWAAAPALVIAFFFCACLVTAALDLPFALECSADGNEWGTMQPMIAGVPFGQSAAQGCMWGMGDFMYMLPEQSQYDYFKNMPPATVALQQPKSLATGVPETFTVTLKNADGSPATLFVDMDKVVHVIIISKDESVMAHIHPDDAHPLTAEEINSSTFTFTYTFPKSGQYMIAFDYAHGVTLESKQFLVNVDGTPAEQSQMKLYPSSNVFDGYQVSLSYFAPVAGQVETIYYTISKDGKPVTFVPWLGAAMHVSVVDNDFSWYLHVHGEVHPPGTPLPPIIVVKGQVIHSMAAMMTPPVFSYPIEAHLIFPKIGTYTVWGQFNTASGQLVTTAFTVQVNE